MPLANWHRVGARLTLTEVLDRWYAANVPNGAPTTVRNTRSISITASPQASATSWFGS